MAENLVTRILKDHMVSGSLEPGEEVALRIDQTLLQDATGTMACLQFERMGVERIQVDFAVQYVDHNIHPARPQEPRRPPLLAGVRSEVRHVLLAAGQRHLPLPARRALRQAGATLIGPTPTTSSGALSSIAIGAGGLDVALVMAGQPFETPAPKVVGVELTGGYRTG